MSEGGNDALLEKVDAVLDCVQPVYKDENFDSLKHVRFIRITNRNLFRGTELQETMLQVSKILEFDQISHISLVYGGISILSEAPGIWCSVYRSPEESRTL